MRLYDDFTVFTACILEYSFYIKDSTLQFYSKDSTVNFLQSIFYSTVSTVHILQYSFHSKDSTVQFLQSKFYSTVSTVKILHYSF